MNVTIYVRLAVTVLVTAMILSFSLATYSQDDKVVLEQEEKALVIDSLLTMLNRDYVFPDKAREMGELLSKNFKEGIYNDYNDPGEFATRITEDMRSVSHDKHLWLGYSPEQIALLRQMLENENTDVGDEEMIKRLSKSNFGFREVKILDGNIGYMKLNSFVNAKYGAPTAAAAMQMLAFTDAIIFDLRDNGGGSPSMIQFLTTYLVRESTHLNTFYWRPTDELQQFWTMPYVPGKHMPDVDVYVLTSQYTFSGAEEFTYNLKNMERAVIVGETTGGGAHPVDRLIINDGFGVSMPKGRAINPITETNWEGVGITPHYEVSSPDALDKALELAYDSLMRKTDDPERLAEYQWKKDALKAKLEPVKLDESTMKKYTGTYEVRTLSLENGDLYYQREDRPKYKMIPMNETTFMFEEVPYFRLKVILENGKPVAVEGIYDNGRTDRHERTK
jgi:hypothetical protein